MAFSAEFLAVTMRLMLEVFHFLFERRDIVSDLVGERGALFRSELKVFGRMVPHGYSPPRSSVKFWAASHLLDQTFSKL